MTHGNTIAHADGGNHDRGSACHAHTGLHRLGNLIQMKMSGHDLTVGTHHTDQRTIQLFLSISHGVEQTAVRRTLNPLGNICTS